MERVLIGVTKKDRVSNQDLRKNTEVQDIIQEIKSKKWRWAGHLARRQDDRWTHKRTLAYTRGRGRQSRWMDDIEENGSITWKRTAQDRVT